MAGDLGARIKELRKKRGLTLDQLAELTGSSKSYIWELENKAPPRPSADKLSKIADKLGVTITYLIGEQAEEDATDANFYRNFQKLDKEKKEMLRRMVQVWDDDE
ncbi:MULTISPECIES: helix-turn-helix domain-containing protein [Maricaulis]|uniref:helix-turn-helix domain-containing protein n=1 Tax=Maricaulis TaxID=74317 RepID=UPI00110912FB|nr:helix-turn-helix transcriptional regulator [Maricaulis alexandrii]MCR9118425.1 helix-turn-helix domain-containing protein [bacterium]